MALFEVPVNFEMLTTLILDLSRFSALWSSTNLGIKKKPHERPYSQAGRLVIFEIFGITTQKTFPDFVN